MSARNQRYVEGAAVAAVLVLAIALRVTRLERGFWEDEAVEYMLGAARPFWGSFTYQPFPLYHVLAHLALYFSDAEWVIRVPSFLAGIGGIAALYLLTRTFFGVAAAFVAALLLTFSTFHISVSTEARFYSLTMLAAVLALWTLQTAVTRDSRRDWIVYAVTGALANMAHLMMLPLIASMAGGAAIWTVYHERRVLTARLRNLVLATLLTLLGVVIAGLGGGYNLARFLASDSVAEEDSVVLDDLGNPIAVVHTTQLTVAEYAGYFSDYVEGATGGLAALLIALGIIGLVDLIRRRAPAALAIGAALILPPLPFFFVTVTHFYHPRYFSAVLPFVLLLVAGGVAAAGHGAKWVVERLFDCYRTTEKSDPARRLAVYGAVAAPFVVFALQMAPVSARGLNHMYAEDFTRGLHFEFAHKQTTQFLREASAPSDFAAMCVPRPDWRYYYRKNLLDHLNAPVKAEEPFSLWYVGGMANCVNWNDVPTHAGPPETIGKEWLDGRKILRFDVRAPHIRTLATESDLTRVDRSTRPPLRLPAASDGNAELTIQLEADGETAVLVTEPVPALPHRYVELIATASGPPQWALAVNYYDTTGRFLQQEVLRLREVQTQREPHPTGDAPPAAPSPEPQTVKLADVSPPLAAWVVAEVLVEGDTRRGDIYEIHALSLRGNWAEESPGERVEFPPFYSESGALNGWAVSSPAGELPRQGADASQMVVSAAMGSPRFRIESRPLSVDAFEAFELAIPFSGAIEFLHPSLVFFDARGQRLDRVQLTAEPVYEWWSTRNMLIVPADEGGWSTLTATVRVPQDAAEVQLVLDADAEALEAARPSGGSVTLRQPWLSGYI